MQNPVATTPHFAALRSIPEDDGHLHEPCRHWVTRALHGGDSKPNSFSSAAELAPLGQLHGADSFNTHGLRSTATSMQLRIWGKGDNTRNSNLSPPPLIVTLNHDNLQLADYSGNSDSGILRRGGSIRWNNCPPSQVQAEPKDNDVCVSSYVMPLTTTADHTSSHNQQHLLQSIFASAAMKGGPF